MKKRNYTVGETSAIYRGKWPWFSLISVSSTSDENHFTFTSRKRCEISLLINVGSLYFRPMFSLIAFTTKRAGVVACVTHTLRGRTCRLY